MGKGVLFAIVSLTFVLLGTSCSSIHKNNSVTTELSEKAQVQISGITVDSPMTLSNNDLFPVIREYQYLRVKMIKGRYYEDWNPGAYMGRIYEGDFILELSDEFGNTISTVDLKEFYSQSLLFSSTFDIAFDDYNDDGNIDFTIGQYASSNGNEYKLFTLRKDGKIEELPVKDYPYLFISDTTGRYSTKLIKIDKVTFKKQYYNNAEGKSLEDIFRWNEKEFVHVGK